MDTDLQVATTTDTAAVAEAVANGDEQGSRSPAPKAEVEMDGSTAAVSFEHERSERTLLLERLAQHETDLEALIGPEADSVQLSSTEPSEEGQPVDESKLGIDMAAVREAATSDAIEDARRLHREAYYQDQAKQHFPQQTELDQLRAQLAVPFAQRMQELRAKTPDIAELDKRSNIPIPPAVGDALLALSGGPEATLYLIRHPEEARQLQQVPEHVAVAKVAQLTARLDPATKRRAVSNAPAPISPVGGSSTKSSIPLDQADYQTYRRVRDQQAKERFRR